MAFLTLELFCKLHPAKTFCFGTNSQTQQLINSGSRVELRSPSQAEMKVFNIALLQKGPTRRHLVQVEFSSFHLYEGNYRTNRSVNIGDDVFLTTILCTQVLLRYEEVQSKLGKNSIAFMTADFWRSKCKFYCCHHARMSWVMCFDGLWSSLSTICSTESGWGVASIPLGCYQP